MTSPPSGILGADRLSWPADARTFILQLQKERVAHQEEIGVLRQENGAYQERSPLGVLL
jgi:hypothetical protein